MEYINGLKKESEAVEDQLFNIAVYSEGSFTFTEVSLMSFVQRERAVKMLNKRAEKLSGKEYM